MSASSQLHDEKALKLPSQRNSLPSLLRNPPSSLSSDSASSSDPEYVPDAPDPHPDHLPSSITHAIHSEVRKIYESPKKKAPSSFIGPIHGSAGVEVEIEEGGQKHMHWLEKEGEEDMEKQRNLEDEMDEEENEDYLSKEDRQEKMGSLLERIGEKHDGEDEQGKEESEKGELEQKVEEIGGISEESLTTIHGVVEMEEDEEDGKYGEERSEKRKELEDQLCQTLASSNLLSQIGDNYRCDCYDDEDQEMTKGVSDQYGMGIEGGLNSNSEEEKEGDDSDSLYRSMSLPDQQPEPPQRQASTEQHPTKEDKSTTLKNLKKKEQKKRKKEERKRAKLAGELEKVKGEKRKAVDEVVSMSEGGSTEKKRKRKSEKGKGLNASRTKQRNCLKRLRLFLFSSHCACIGLLRRMREMRAVFERESERIEIEQSCERILSLPKLTFPLSLSFLSLPISLLHSNHSESRVKQQETTSHSY